MSNLSTVCQLLERLVLALLPARFHHFHSITIGIHSKGYCSETALLEVLDSVYSATDDGQTTAAVALDLRLSARSTIYVSHSTLLERLQTEFGVTGVTVFRLYEYVL